MGHSKLLASLDSAIQLEAKLNFERKSNSPDPVQSPKTEYPSAPDDCEEVQVSLGKQAKTLSKRQIEAILGLLARTRYPTRNRVILLLSVKSGLRAKEIAGLTWTMVTNADGQISRAIHLHDNASKGRSGRIIPMHSEVRLALQELLRPTNPKSDDFVIRTERSIRTSAQVIVNLFARWYETLGFNGCSSHSGRRTFITNAARKISTVDGSLRDVQILAGHSNLRTTQRYIEPNASAQTKVIQLI
jgi:integrase/recombinase XerD